MKKVVYISFMRLSETVARNWYIDYLRTNGIAVEYWDLIPLLFGGLNEPDSIQTDYLLTPKTYDEIEKLLKLPENKNATYVMLVNYDGSFVRLYRILSKNNCRMFFLEWGNSPVRSHSQLRQVVRRWVADPFPVSKKVLHKIKALAYRRLKLIRPFDVVFAAGYAALTKHPGAGKIVPINYVDYDLYIRAKSEAVQIVKGRYAVFLDVYLPFHADMKITGLKALDSQRYFFSLNRFFQIIEQAYGIKVIIAAHPKADYGNEAFQGRDIYKGLTPELVKDSDFVISHYSTSLCYAILDQKPIIFVYTDEMKVLYENTFVSYLYDYADSLDAHIYNIDEEILGDQVSIRDINLERYENYKYKYLTTKETEHTTTRELFWREIIS